MTSPVDLINQALDQIGAADQTIVGISPPNPPNSKSAQVMSRMYQQQMDALFRSAHWNSARFQTGAQGTTNPPPLTLLKAAWGTPENPSGALPQPPTGWQYEYAQPVDCLKVRFVIPSPKPPYEGSAVIMTNVGVQTPPLINTSMKYVVAIDTDSNGNQIKVILTNAREAQCVYTARVPNPDLWDALLQNAAIATLAAWAVNPLLRNADLMRERVQMAVGLIAQARVSDGDEGVMSMDHEPDWMRVRNAGSGFGWGGGEGGYYAGWDAMSMPDGVSY